MKPAIIALAAMLASSAAHAADKPGEKPADKMAGMQMSAPMSMGLPLSPMPSIYAGRGRQAGRAGVQGPGRRTTWPISTKDPGDPEVLRPGREPAVRLQPRRGDPLVPRGRPARSGLRHVLVGRRLALGPNINLPMPPDAIAPAWQALQQAQALRAQGLAARAGLDRGAGGPLLQGSQGRPPRPRRGLRRGHGQALARASRRPRRRRRSTPRR